MAGRKGKPGEYRFGIIGLGMIANFHARAIQAMKGGRLVAVASRSEKKARAFAGEYGVQGHGSYGALVAREDVDIVTICTPSGAHLEPALMAARARKHVICEKPLEVTLARTDRMIAACRKHRVRLAGIFPSRTSEVYRQIKKAVDQKRFGRLSLGSAYIKWYRSQAYYDSGAWRGTWALDGGGCLMNQGIHTIDLLQWFMGPAAEVKAFCACLAHKRIEVEDTAAAAIRFRSGALGVIEAATSAFPGHAKKIELCGSAGSVATDEDDLATWSFARPRKEDRTLLRRLGGRDTGKGGAADPAAISFVGHQRQFEDFVRALGAGGRPLVDGAEGRKAIELILAIYRSARTGRTVRLPL